jgi:hypothetical protein
LTATRGLVDLGFDSPPASAPIEPAIGIHVINRAPPTEQSSVLFR